VVKVAGDLIFFARNPSGELELPEGTESEYRSLREALDANGMEDALCPSWIPKGYALQRLNVKRTERLVRVSALYVSDQNELTITISRSESGSVASAMETNGTSYTEFEHNNNVFYISDNVGVYQVYSIISNCSYLFVGMNSEGETELIIQSMYR
jgi:hypothetical protein